MRTPKLGVTDLDLTVVGLGTAGIGAGQIYGWAPSDDAEGIATAKCAPSRRYHP